MYGPDLSLTITSSPVLTLILILNLDGIDEEEN